MGRYAQPNQSNQQEETMAQITTMIIWKVKEKAHLVPDQRASPCSTVLLDP
jgi:hypothetical protein